MGYDRLISGGLFLIYVGLALGGGFERAAIWGIYLFIFLFCAWFPEELSDYFDFGVGSENHSLLKGFRRPFAQTFATPGIVVRVAAWIMLLLPALGIALWGLRWFRGH